ncbi:MAG: hypothetical protein QOD88_4052 [Mycobacterium sp.]|nr:hypothetical protein [Mycobacterium sp.]
MGSRKSCVSTVRSGSNQSSSGVRSIPNASDNLVGVAGFEPTASSSRTKRATKLRHTPRKATTAYRTDAAMRQSGSPCQPLRLAPAGLSVLRRTHLRRSGICATVRRGIPGMSATLNRLNTAHAVQRKRVNHDGVRRRGVRRTAGPRGAMAAGYRSGQRRRPGPESIPVARAFEFGQRRSRRGRLQSMGPDPLVAKVGVGVAVAAVGEQCHH